MINAYYYNIIFMLDDAWMQAENTYLLTLDGAHRLQSGVGDTAGQIRMKKNKKVGAACGRIHPI